MSLWGIVGNWTQNTIKKKDSYKKLLLVGIYITVIKHRIILGCFHSVASGRQDQDLHNSYRKL